MRQLPFFLLWANDQICFTVFSSQYEDETKFYSSIMKIWVINFFPPFIFTLLCTTLLFNYSFILLCTHVRGILMLAQLLRLMKIKLKSQILLTQQLKEQQLWLKKIKGHLRPSSQAGSLGGGFQHFRKLLRLKNYTKNLS